MEIDLGKEVVFNVKLGSENYPLVEPTVEHVKAYQKDMKEGEEIDAFMSLICNLGMPKDVCSKLSVTQLKKLADGLLGGLDEKK